MSFEGNVYLIGQTHNRKFISFSQSLIEGSPVEQVPRLALFLPVTIQPISCHGVEKWALGRPACLSLRDWVSNLCLEEIFRTFWYEATFLLAGPLQFWSFDLFFLFKKELLQAAVWWYSPCAVFSDDASGSVLALIAARPFMSNVVGCWCMMYSWWHMICKMRNSQWIESSTYKFLSTNIHLCPVPLIAVLMQLYSLNNA